MNEIDLLVCERFRRVVTNYTEIAEIAEKNAQALIKEEEEAKVKANKKKKKKKKASTANNILNKDVKNISDEMENLEINQDDNDAEALDVNAAFVNNVIKKCKTTVPVPKKDVQIKETSSKKRDLNHFITEAIEYQNDNKFKEAVQSISEAINLAPDNYELVLRRSYIHFKLSNFKKSIRDANKVLELSANNPDAYFRLGEANFAIKNLSEADAAYTKLLNVNIYNEKVKERLSSIRVQQLEEMGYHPNEAYTAVLKSKNKTLDEAIDFLSNLEQSNVEEELYYSDEDEDSEEDEDEEDSEEEEEQINRQPVACDGARALNKSAPKIGRPPISMNNKPNINVDKKSKLFTDPANPLGCCSLFVGNLKKGITYEEVENVFTKFGDIDFINLSTFPNCFAFINYTESDSAGRAMEAMQENRWLLSTKPLLVKYSIKAIQEILSKLTNPEEILMKYKEPPKFKPTRRFKPHPVNKASSGIKPSVKLPSASSMEDKSTTQAPVVQKPSQGVPRPKPQTEECYFWRTMGCTYGDHCFNLHIPEHKGIDFRVRGYPLPQHSS